MTARKAERKFEQLRAAILADNKVDWKETEVLLDFINPYVVAKNKTFVKFSCLLKHCREDGKITPDESKQLVAGIDNIREFLRNEAKVEWALLFTGSLAIVAWLLYWLIV